MRPVMEEKRPSIIAICLAVSVLLHLGLVFALPAVGRFDMAGASHPGVVSLMFAEPSHAKQAAEVAPRRQPPAPQKESRNTLKTPKPAPAPTTLPRTAVTSSAPAAEPAAETVIPVSHDTGGTGLTDSKGTSRDNREITSGPAPEPEPPKKTAPPPPETPKVDLDALRAAYARRVRERISARREYPVSARRRGDQGTTLVQFTLQPSGEVAAINVVRSSGSSELDAAAAAAVRRAAPLPPMPPEIGAKAITVRVPIVFQLDQS